MTFYLFLAAIDLYLFYKIEEVYRLRCWLLDRIDVAAREDVVLGRDWHWRIEDFELVSFPRMLFSINPLKLYPTPIFYMNQEETLAFLKDEEPTHQFNR